ncbi:MAG: hypothetical protein AAGG08_18985, partial [Actinomycetota bacterium]
MATEDDFWGDAGDWSGTAGADRRDAERIPATDSDATPAAWVTGQIARVLGGSNDAGRRAHGNPRDARWTQEVPVVDADSSAPAEDAPPTDPHAPTTDVPAIVDATPVADTFDDVWFDDDDGYGDPAGASPNPAEDDAWSSLGDWDVESEPQRKLPIDPLLAKLGVLAVVVTLAVPVVLSLRSGSDSATLETGATELTAPTADVTILPTTLSEIVAEPEATAAPETAAAEEPEATTAATTAGTSAATVAEADAELTTRRATPVATADGSDTDAGGVDASTTAAADACGADYAVVGGDYWIRLADGAGVDVDELLAVNDATLDTPLYPG